MLSLYLAGISAPEERDKFTEIYYAYRDRMFAIANGILHNHHDSEEALQDAFMNISRHIDTLPEASSPLTKGYVFKAVENCALNIKKRIVDRNAHDSIDEIAELPSSDDVMRDVESRDSVERVLAYINTMPEHYRSAVYLHIIHGLSAREIAELQGIKKETVKTRLQRAMKQLRNIAREKGL